MLIYPKDFEHKYEDQRRERAYCEAAVRRGELSKEDAEKICADHRFAPVFMGPISQFCFFCGNKLTIPCIMWHGRSGKNTDFQEIFMHIACAERLAAGLNSDVKKHKNGLRRNK
jgi:hypothetical protein